MPETIFQSWNVSMDAVNPSNAAPVDSAYLDGAKSAYLSSTLTMPFSIVAVTISDPFICPEFCSANPKPSHLPPEVGDNASSRMCNVVELTTLW